MNTFAIHFLIENVLQNNQSSLKWWIHSLTLHFPIENVLQSQSSLKWWLWIHSLFIFRSKTCWLWKHSLHFPIENGLQSTRLSGSTWIFLVFKFGPVLPGLNLSLSLSTSGWDLAASFSVGLYWVPSSLASVSASVSASVAEIWSHLFQLVYTRSRPPLASASVSAPVAEIWSHLFQLIYTRSRPPWLQSQPQFQPQSQHRWPRFNLHFDLQFSLDRKHEFMRES